ncbi:hypothetical protein CYL21_5421 [Plasmodium falciparum NF54]|uniref:Uncharacterized protein n=2 Tax=Plasmodium falciparum TaxID=5833 RepID=A0A5K1K8X4_PLAF7|nr:conserved Plasmodium protein, unknown function [Plasmodium falciparum 3D7]EWC86688.1 hypothetical protein PFNF54_04707 [Plasmodium falciparum NF54]KAF4326454.1 hypothetical protein CYL21_5421 [Plasmodium falciparum NF54]PKC46977.1 hypothetical protein CK202_2594 [Plasmodium falciparum NF54]VWP77759.1 conserved Plasmodium protein, unknown function [Plasmodium falciparum 3D7]|eukprot:XP_001350161.1 conserved Plasmodium protein, unknown function [Plasmodium falciparum 3D7]
MFLASYFDRKDKVNEKSETEIEEIEYKKNNLEKVLKNALYLHKEKNVKLKDEADKKERIKEYLSSFLKKKVKDEHKMNLSYFIYDENEKRNISKYSVDNFNEREEDQRGIYNLLKENKSLNNISKDMLILANYLQHDKLKNIDIISVYNIIDKYIDKYKLEIDEIKKELDKEADKEIKKKQNNLDTIYNIKKKLGNIHIVEEENSNNTVEYMLNEMKIIKKLIKQKEYIICVKNTLISLDYAKKCAVNRKYDESLNIILDIVNILHIFKKNFKKQVIKNIEFFIPLLAEYYINKSKLLLSSIHWGNNISYVSTNSLEDVINDMDMSEDNEEIYDDMCDDNEDIYDDMCDDNDIMSDNICDNTCDDNNEKGDGTNNYYQDFENTDINYSTTFINAEKTKNVAQQKEKKRRLLYYNRHMNKFHDKINNSVIFDKEYMGLIKKESLEFINILICCNYIEKINICITEEKEENENILFVKQKYYSSSFYVEELASSIINFFRSFFQNDKSPLFKFDKPEWGLKYLFYQSIISNYILKMLLNYAHMENFKSNNIILKQTLEYMFTYNNKYKEILRNINNIENLDRNPTSVNYKKETIAMSSVSSDVQYERDHTKLFPEHNNDNNNNNNNDNNYNDNYYRNNNYFHPMSDQIKISSHSYLLDNNFNIKDRWPSKNTHIYYNTYNCMKDEDKQILFEDISNYKMVLEKLNYEIITECRLYILSRITYFIHLYTFDENNKDDIKKSFLNFMQHIFLIYKKWWLYDRHNCKHLLDDFYNNTYIKLNPMENERTNQHNNCNNNNNNNYYDDDDNNNNNDNNYNNNNNNNNDNNLNGINHENNINNYNVDNNTIQHLQNNELLKNRNLQLSSEENIIHMNEKTNDGVYIRDFFMLNEKEFLIDILNDMSNKKCCIKLKNNIILDENDCINEYSDIFIQLLKKIKKRIWCFRNNHEFMEEYMNNVVKKLLIIVKDEFRFHWNNISDLIGDSEITCLLYISFHRINNFLNIYQYKKYLEEIKQNFDILEKKMFHNFLDAFYHFISIRIYNLFSVSNVFHEYIINNLYKIKKNLPDIIFIQFLNRILYKLDKTILKYLLNQNISFLQNELYFQTFINNSYILLQQIEELNCKNKKEKLNNNTGIFIYNMNLLREILKLMTDNIDTLKDKINEIKCSYAFLKNKNNWIDQVTRITNSLLKDYSSSDDNKSSHHDYKENWENKCKNTEISIIKIKMLLLRRPDIKTIAEKSIVVKEFIEY